ncbi:CAP domain-containing protein [Salinimicrobium oceani]|uniref:CAP domain-containing protein n=1 Tax=Salinimicrobium oceani TaxID=2722702 RepID=A0ABX1D218_9FLAO|nr:CAP domain-containing protein [Salinimicrobium oceani]NJW52586.1 CAP domain-containing protein [Salinimicrobium oceani]
MKNLTYSVWLLAICVFSLTSCSKDSVEEMETADLTTKPAPVEYSSIETEILDLVNAYRAQKGLSELVDLAEGSVQAASHNEHMIENDEVCHDFFGNRYQALVNSVNAKAVSENVAFGFRTADAVVNAWIKSDGHRKNLEGDHTHFGISVKEAKDGKLYFTNIFVKK